jgi:U3 small nucleolar RNA-associated protein 13
MRIFKLKPDLSNHTDVLAELQRTLKPHSSPVISITVDHTGSLLATGGADGLVKVWDVVGGFPTHTLRGHSGLVSALRFFEADPSIVAPVNDINKNKQRRKPASQEDEIMRDVGLSGLSIKGLRLASGGEDSHIRVWDLYTRTCVSVLKSHVSVVRSLDFSRAENALLSASRDKTAILWDASTWKSKKIIPVLEGLEAIGFLAGGSYFYTGGESGRIRIWNSHSGREATQEQASGNEGDTIVDAIHHEGLDFILSVHTDHSLLLHSIESISSLIEDSFAPLSILQRISGTHDEIIDMAYLMPDQSLMALATNSEDIRIISLATSGNVETSYSQYFGADVALLEGHEDIIICLDVDWSGHWIATGAKDNTARLWRIDGKMSSYSCYATFTGHAESIGAVSLPHSPPSTMSPAHTDPLSHPPPYLITGSQDRTVKRWKINQFKTPGKPTKALYTRKAHDKDINSITTHPTLPIFASASQDRTVKIWSTEEGEVQGILRGHRRGIWSVQFSPKDTSQLTGGESNTQSSHRGLVLTSSGDKTLKIWSLSDYSCLRTFEGHTNTVLKALWLPSGPRASSTKVLTLVASAGGDGLVKIWDAQSCECAATLDNHTDRVWALAAHPSSGVLASGGADAVITFWQDTTSATAEVAAEAATQRVEQDQALQNYIRTADYRSAITLALQLNHPARLLAVFTDTVNQTPPEAGSLSGIKSVDSVLGSLSDTQILTLLKRIRDWNTNARASTVAQRILNCVVKLYPAKRLVAIRGVGEVLEGIRAYSERHYKRVEELLEESWIVEYTLGQMGGLGGGVGRLAIQQPVQNGEDVVMG